VKFKVIHELEKQLPASLYAYEWQLLEGGEGNVYKPVTHIEQWIPVIFILLYVGLVLFVPCLTCQHSAMKHPRQSKRVPATPSALAVPSYHRILVKHGLIEKTLSIPDAYKMFFASGR
jgi:hypothetical protein